MSDYLILVVFED